MADNKTPCAAAEEQKKPVGRVIVDAFVNGLIKENPVLCLVLGTCATMAVTTSASNAIGMGAATTMVLICSNVVISLLRKVIPDKVRIPAYITIIAGFVSIVQMLVKAYTPSLDTSLGIFLPLIVVNCIILGRAEMFASKNGAALSALDGLTMGIGFTAALLAMGIIREIFGAGAIFGHELTFITQSSVIAPIIIFILPPGGFFVFGMLIALVNKLNGKKPPEASGCAGCPAAATCTLRQTGGEDVD